VTELTSVNSYRIAATRRKCLHHVLTYRITCTPHVCAKHYLPRTGRSKCLAKTFCCKTPRFPIPYLKYGRSSHDRLIHAAVHAADDPSYRLRSTRNSTPNGVGPPGHPAYGRGPLPPVWAPPNPLGLYGRFPQRGNFLCLNVSKKEGKVITRGGSSFFDSSAIRPPTTVALSVRPERSGFAPPGRAWGPP
jgi:hypothetical protein